MTERQPGALRGFVATLMVGVGFLMVATCGLCTAVFAIGSLIDMAQGHSGGEFSSASVLQAALTLGLPPIVVGGLLIWGGFRLGREPKPPPSDPPPG